MTDLNYINKFTDWTLGCTDWVTDLTYIDKFRDRLIQLCLFHFEAQLVLFVVKGAFEAGSKHLYHIAVEGKMYKREM